MPTKAKRKKVLLVTRNLPPLVGGMERMMHQFTVGLLQYTELTVIGPKGCKQHLPPEVTVRETSSQLGLFSAVFYLACAASVLERHALMWSLAAAA